MWPAVLFLLLCSLIMSCLDLWSGTTPIPRPSPLSSTHSAHPISYTTLSPGCQTIKIYKNPSPSTLTLASSLGTMSHHPIPFPFLRLQDMSSPPPNTIPPHTLMEQRWTEDPYLRLILLVLPCTQCTTCSLTHTPEQSCSISVITP